MAGPRAEGGRGEVNLPPQSLLLKVLTRRTEGRRILSAQKAPAGRLSGPKYNFVYPKGPCGTLVQLKVQFDPPKKPLRVDFLAQIKILSAQMAMQVDFLAVGPANFSQCRK